MRRLGGVADFLAAADQRPMVAVELVAESVSLYSKTAMDALRCRKMFLVMGSLLSTCSVFHQGLSWLW